MTLWREQQETSVSEDEKTTRKVGTVHVAAQCVRRTCSAPDEGTIASIASSSPRNGLTACTHGIKEPAFSSLHCNPPAASSYVAYVEAWWEETGTADEILGRI